MGLTVRDVIKALADHHPDEKVVFCPGTMTSVGGPILLGQPRTSIVSIQSLQHVLTSPERKVCTFVVLIGESK